MQQNKIDLADRGWESMHKILDREMPQKDRKRRLFLYLLTGGLALLLLIAFFSFPLSESPTTKTNSNITTNNSNASILTEENKTNTTIQSSGKESSTESTSNYVSTDPEAETTNDLPQSKINPINQTDNNSLETGSTVSQSELIDKTSSPAVKSSPQATPPHLVNTTDASTTLSESQLPTFADSDSQTDSESMPSNIESTSPPDKSITDIKPAKNSPALSPIPNQKIQSPVTSPAETEVEQNSTDINESLSLQDQNSIEPNQVVNDIPEQEIIKEKMTSIPKEEMDLNSPTHPTDIDKSKSESFQTMPGLKDGSIENENLIADIQLLPTLLKFLDVPVSQVLAMTLTLVTPTPIVKTPEYVLQHQWEIGLYGLYAHKATGLGFEFAGGYRQELSKNLSAHILLGGGCIDISNPATLGELDNLTSNAIEVDRGPETGDTAGDPGPAGPAGAAGPEGVEVGDMGEVGFEPEIPDLKLTAAQLRSLSLSNISSIKYVTANTGIQLAATRRFHIGASVGLDYVLNTSFNDVFIEDDKFLTLDAASNNGLTNVELEQGNSLLGFTEAYSSFDLSETVKLKAGYKYYLKAIFPALGKNWLNQFRLGVFFNLRGKNK